MSGSPITARVTRGLAWTTVMVATALAGAVCAGFAIDISHQHPHSAAVEAPLVVGAILLFMIAFGSLMGVLWLAMEDM